MHPTITVSDEGDWSFLKEAVQGLVQGAVYVGIPEDKTERNRQMVGPQYENSYITNAALLYIHTNGSTKWNIPERPVIEPSIEANQEKIEGYLNKAADLQLDGRTEEANRQLKLAGRFAANNAKEWFFDPRNGWAQNAPATIRKKLRKLRNFYTTKSGKRVLSKRNKAYWNASTILQIVSESKYQPLYGTTPLDSINTPLIDTDEMRRAITYVVDEIAKPKASVDEPDKDQSKKNEEAQKRRQESGLKNVEESGEAEVAEVLQTAETAVAEVGEAAAGAAEIAVI